jgi:hypothetical protein
MKRFPALATSLLLIFAICALAHAQSAPRSASPGRIATTTRLVALFSGQERELNLALQQKDAATLDRLLSPDFQVWTPEPPGHPIPREDWVQQNAGGSFGGARLTQMAVRDLGNSHVVSFVMSRASGASFVVDVWQDAGNGTWKLTDRYVSAVRRE